jgi:hypothetical protein
MLTPTEAAHTLLKYAPQAAPITWCQLAGAIGAPSPSAARARGRRMYLGEGGWALASRYEYMLKERHPSGPSRCRWCGPPSKSSSLGAVRHGPGRRRGRSRSARPSRASRYRIWSYGLTHRRAGGERRREATRMLSKDEEVRVLVAYEGPRLVGSMVIYFVDTRSEEDTDIHEIVGPGSVGPIFTKASYDWGGHAIVMDSLWVAPDRRRAGIATAMAERVAGIGLPAWGEFRDPWLAAFFLHRWPPTRPVHRSRYWPLHEAYQDATSWTDEEQKRAELDVTLWLSDDELTDMTETSESATKLLGYAMDPHDDVRSALDDGGWELEIQNASIAAANGGWRLTGHLAVTYLAEPLLARAGLEAYLLSPFDGRPRIDTLEQALDTTVIAAVRRKLTRGRGHVEHWQPSTSAAHT